MRVYVLQVYKMYDSVYDSDCQRAYKWERITLQQLIALHRNLCALFHGFVSIEDGAAFQGSYEHLIGAVFELQGFFFLFKDAWGKGD